MTYAQFIIALVAFLKSLGHSVTAPRFQLDSKNGVLGLNVLG